MVTIRTLAAVLVGVLVVLHTPQRTRDGRSGDGGDVEPAGRDERGLSQSAETAILLAGAVAVAAIVVTVITAFVKSKLPK